MLFTLWLFIGSVCFEPGTVIYNSLFKLWYRHSLPDTEIYTAMSLLELIFVREGPFTLPGFTKSQIISLITALATA